MKKFILLVFIPLLGFSCYKAKRDLIENAPQSFSEDFESYTSVQQLFENDRWTGDQKTISGNTYDLDSTIVHNGHYSLRCSAAATESDVVSKASLLKNDFAFEQGHTIEFTGWYYLDTPGSAENVFLIDIEDPAYISYSPGLRIMIGSDGGLLVERKKMQHGTLTQTGSAVVPFPLRQWVKLKLELKLSTRQKGEIRLYQNDELILNYGKVQTLPKDFLFASMGTSGLFRQIETGLTANSSAGAAILYMDDLSLRLLE